MKDLSIVYQEANKEGCIYASGEAKKQESIAVESSTVKALLADKCLCIPEYQRPYTWGEKEINRLFEDLKDHFETNENNYYYLGSIILHQEAKDQPLNIIDGQQRLTTLSIIQYIQGVSSTLQYASPLSQQKILENYRYLKEKKLPEVDLSLINITLVTTQSEDDAYTFFESQNTGGIRLSGLDIIKAHHLRAIEPLERNHHAKRWENLHCIEPVVNSLLKARRWQNLLGYRSIPSFRDEKGTKEAVIEEFSQIKSTDDKDIAYQMIKIQRDDSSSLWLEVKNGYDARQPCNDGCNFIAYLSYHHTLYDGLFVSYDLVDDKTEKFYSRFIANNAGSVYLSELFKASILLYVSKHGIQKLYDASLWIFRCIYSLRLTHASVREQSIPSFLKHTHLLDRIDASFTHKALLQYLKTYTYDDICVEEIENSPIRKDFVKFVLSHFNDKKGDETTISAEEYDKKLIKIITEQTAEG